MILPGLTSITFRDLSCGEIVALAESSGLKSIEWGGDVHVPHGDAVKAGEVARMTADAGLGISSYGSYYRCGMEEPRIDFEQVLEVALALKAPIVRVWAGRVGSRECLPEQRRAIVKDLARICALAAKEAIKIGLEFHRNTLNDSAGETLKLIGETECPNLGTYWQPPVGMALQEACESLKQVLPFLMNLHVFHWAGNPPVRLLLEQGQGAWMEYFRLVRQKTGMCHALIEFVKDNAVASFRSDACILRKLTAESV